MKTKETKKEEKETSTNPPLALDMREELKIIIQKELKALPETLSKLAPEKRLSILIKLMPFIMPKVDTINFEKGEPEYEMKRNGFSMF